MPVAMPAATSWGLLLTVALPTPFLVAQVTMPGQKSSARRQQGRIQVDPVLMPVFDGHLVVGLLTGLDRGHGFPGHFF